MNTDNLSAAETSALNAIAELRRKDEENGYGDTRRQMLINKVVKSPHRALSQREVMRVAYIAENAA